MMTAPSSASSESEQREPLLSVLCINKNNRSTLSAALSSIEAQSYENFEIVFADGGSTDGSLELAQTFRRLRIVEGEDRSRADGVLRAVRGARGKYIAFMTSTDGYVSTTWLKTAVDYLEQDPEAGLVWGASISMDTKGQLVARFFPKQFLQRKLAAQKKAVFPLWMSEHDVRLSYFSELSYVVRADIYKNLIEPDEACPTLAPIDPILRFHFEFIRQGYLPVYLPSLVYFGRSHEGQAQFSSAMTDWLARYNRERRAYLAALFTGAKTHIWRDGQRREIGRLGQGGAIARYLYARIFHSRLAYRIRKRFGM